MTTSFRRMHRYRKHPALRDMLAEYRVRASDFIYPVFVKATLSSADKQPISGLPGVYQHGLDSALKDIEFAVSKGIRSIILFGIPESKDDKGSHAYADQGIVQSAIAAVKQRFPDLFVIADVCLCAYTSHGHCGVLNHTGINNDETLTLLNAIAISYAQNGVDCVAPSGMMDGTVTSIRSALDAQGFQDVSIMNYSSKYASALYGPFREASGVSHDFKGDRSAYQISPAQSDEGIKEAMLDQDEGADFLIVKPASWYLDIVQRLSQTLTLPIVGYHVSGEYSMIKAAAAQGMLNEQAAFLEVMVSLKRAGCSLIISYAAPFLDLDA